MLFNSFEFLLFFPTVVIAHFLTPYRFRWIILLSASYYFYAFWKPEYLILIWLSTAIDYYAAKNIDRTSIVWKRKIWLTTSIVFNLSLLLFFKYSGFILRQISSIASLFDISYSAIQLNITLPIGISFYTFQTMGYTIDVFRGGRKYERHLGKFALYVAFFPQLVAGPIERSTRLLPQFYKKFDFDYKRVTDGLKLMAFGFFKKLVIADRLAIYVDKIYNHPEIYKGEPLILATYMFAFQIFFDFSAYTDIARGAAKIFGIQLMKNFRGPYQATSIRDFWARWHISLSTWFRDYLYIPLGGNRVKKSRWYYNLIVTFLISGLWHGADWNFVIWGLIHGTYIITSIITKNIREKICEITGFSRGPLLHSFLRALFTFHLVAFSWIFFRANSLSDALLIVSKIFDFSEPVAPSYLALGSYGFAIVIIGILAAEVIDHQLRKGKFKRYFEQKPIYIRWASYLLLLILIIILGIYDKVEFIYFQF